MINIGQLIIVGVVESEPWTFGQDRCTRVIGVSGQVLGATLRACGGVRLISVSTDLIGRVVEEGVHVFRVPFILGILRIIRAVF